MKRILLAIFLSLLLTGSLYSQEIEESDDSGDEINQGSRTTRTTGDDSKRTSGSSSSIRKKSMWYIGFGGGTGDGEIKPNGGGDSTSLSDDNPDPLLTMQFGLGVIFADYIHLGGEIQALYALYSPDDSDYSYSRQFTSYMAVAMFFPFKQLLYVKAGYGLTRYDFMTDHPDGENNSFDGTGFLIGAGLALPLTKSFNLTFCIDYLVHDYPETDDYLGGKVQMWNAYVTFYWF